MFNPNLDTRLVIDEQEYTFSPHPVVPTLVWGQEGRHAIVYRLQNNGDAYALKVFRPVFRHPGLVDTADALWMYHELPGMRVCKQTVIRRETHPDLVEQYEDFDYAMLMPWIEGYTWFDFLSRKETMTLDQSRALTESMAWVLYALELNNLAHCDLSSGNVIIDPALDRIHLIDVEDLYSPWLVPPPYVPTGSMGYQHVDVTKTGQWNPLGDRFAGAVLMAEMLGWAHPEIRQRAWGESYFAPGELQQDTERYALLRDMLRVYDPGFAEAFEQAWRSRALDQCPPIKTWYDLLDSLPYDPVASWAPIDPDKLMEMEPEPVRLDTAEEPVSISGEGNGHASSDSQPGPARRSRKGCRRVVTITLVLALLACYAVFLTVEWSMLSGIFN